jgi:hypothetical protein
MILAKGPNESCDVHFSSEASSIVSQTTQKRRILFHKSSGRLGNHTDRMYVVAAFVRYRHLRQWDAISVWAGLMSSV